jgi:hypothetical protein
VSLADWLNLAQLQLHPGSRSIREVTCSSGMSLVHPGCPHRCGVSSSLRDVLVASGQSSPTWTARALRARFSTHPHRSGNIGSCRRGPSSLLSQSRYIAARPLRTCNRSCPFGRYTLTLEAVRAQEDWSGLATQRRQPFRCRT